MEKIINYFGFLCLFLISLGISLQAQSPLLPHYGGVDVHFTGMADCFRQTVKYKGVLGLWSGLTPSLLKVRFYFHPSQIYPEGIKTVLDSWG